MHFKTLLLCMVVTYSCMLSINALVAGGNNMWAGGDASSLKKEVSKRFETCGRCMRECSDYQDTYNAIKRYRKRREFIEKLIEEKL